MFRIVLDTCALWPSLQRDLLLTLASHRLYEPSWSDLTALELEIHEAEKLVSRFGLSCEEANHRARRLVRRMNEAFPEAQVPDTDQWLAPPHLPDENDAHVLAAAVLGRAGAIVTDNLRDFPAAVVPEGVDVLTPREFLADAIGISPQRAYLAVVDLLSRYRNPPMTFEELLTAAVERYALHEAAGLLRLGQREVLCPEESGS